MSKYSAIPFDRKPRNDEGPALVVVAEAEDRLVVPPAGSEDVPELKIFDMEDQDDDPFGQSIAEKLTADNLEEGLKCIKPGWSPERLDRKVNKFLRLLASQPALTEVQLSEYMGRLVKQLRGCGYTPSTPAAYRKLVKQLARSMSLERRAQRQAKTEAAVANGELPKRFIAVGKETRGAGDNPALWGIYDRQQGETGDFLSNFTLELDEDITVLDDIEGQRVFQGQLGILGRTLPFRISAEEFADNNKLKAVIYRTGGPEVQIHGRMDLLRTAISAISGQDQPIRRRESTTNFGWSTSNVSSSE